MSRYLVGRIHKGFQTVRMFLVRLRKPGMFDKTNFLPAFKGLWYFGGWIRTGILFYSSIQCLQVALIRCNRAGVLGIQITLRFQDNGRISIRCSTRTYAWKERSDVV